jgi:carbonic anhydrase
MNKHTEWCYSGCSCNPEQWGEHYPDALGHEQSPINIVTADIIKDENLPNLVLNYKSNPLKIINNGHTIQLECEAGSTLTFKSKSYNLLQFHFHTLSEHTIDGKYCDFEGHLVHQSEDGEYAVVGFLMNIGHKSELLDMLFKYVPENEGRHDDSNIQYNPLKILNKDPADMGDLDYYHYNGSFTTPPCTEGVKWIVLKEIFEISQDQVDLFDSIIHKNYRPIQALNDRTVLSS